VSAPIFSNKDIPRHTKLGLALLTALLLFPFVRLPGTALSHHPISYSFHLGKELFVGLIIGYTSMVMFMGILAAGQFLDFQMGFGMVSLIDPMTKVNASVMGQFKYIVSLLIFLLVNGHHLLLTALARSFEVSPLTTFVLSASITNNLVRLFCDIFVIALKIGAPAIGVLFMTELILGIIGRTVPQMNVFIVGMPLKIAVGLATVSLILPFFFTYVGRLIQKLPVEAIKVLR